MVIQRWQTVFLLIAAGMMACFTFCSLGQVRMPEFYLDFSTMGFSIESAVAGDAPAGYYMYTWPFFTVSLLSMVLPLIAIFMFRNMKLQHTICIIEMLFIAALAVITWSYGCNSEALQGCRIEWSSLVMTLPVALVADILACRRISADRKLLHSTERLR